MKYTAEEIHYMDNDDFTLGNWELRRLAAIALANLSTEVVDFVMSHSVAIMVTTDEKGCYYPAAQIRGRGILGFPESLLTIPTGEAIEIILHEIAHLWLNHEPTHVLTNEGAEAQEVAANNQVIKWLQQKGGNDET